MLLIMLLFGRKYRYAALLIVSVICYIGTFLFSGLLFHWFTPSGQDCGLNTFFLVFTLILVFVFAIVALHPKVYAHLEAYSYKCSLIC
jgi:serine incorporator 1/3